MSHTDNTDPHWVRALWWEPDHFFCDKSRWYRGERPCDLPAEPIVNAQHGTRWRRRGRCGWIPTWDGLTAGGGWGAPPWFNRVIFTAPERRRVRDDLTLARQQYRATGEVDVDVPVIQHRHQGNWDWW
jgi:hypothetical protein